MRGRFIVTRKEGIALCVASGVFVVIVDRLVIGLGWGQAVLSAIVVGAIVPAAEAARRQRRLRR